MILSNEDFHKLKNNDPELIERIYNEHRKNIFNYLLLKTKGDHFMAKELLNETFCSAIDSVSKLKTPDNIEGWLFRIASRRYIDHMRILYREKRYREIERQKQQLNIQEDIIESLHLKEKVLLLNIAMKRLKPEYQKMLKMKCYDEKNIKEIAQITGRTPKAIENVLYKARKTLKYEITKLFKEYDI